MAERSEDDARQAEWDALNARSLAILTCADCFVLGAFGVYLCPRHQEQFGGPDVRSGPIESHSTTGGTDGGAVRG